MQHTNGETFILNVRIMHTRRAVINYALNELDTPKLLKHFLLQCRSCSGHEKELMTWTNLLVSACLWSWALRLLFVLSHGQLRKQSVQFNNARSLPTLVLFGVPQGSVLGPILFLLYTADLLRLMEQFHLYSHLYADDTQIYGFSAPSAALELQNRVSACVA